MLHASKASVSTPETEEFGKRNSDVFLFQTPAVEGEDEKHVTSKGLAANEAGKAVCLPGGFLCLVIPHVFMR